MRMFKRSYIIEQDVLITRKGASAKELAEGSIYDFMEDDGLKVELVSRPRFRIHRNKFGESINLCLVLRAVGRYEYVDNEPC